MASLLKVSKLNNSLPKSPVLTYQPLLPSALIYFFASSVAASIARCSATLGLWPTASAHLRAVSRASLYDTKLSLVQLKTEEGAQPIKQADESHQINLSVTNAGSYQWITEIQAYPMEDLERIKKELNYQHQIGLLPKDKHQTQVLLHIDKNASWDPVAKLIFAIREEGFDAFPVYEPDEIVNSEE